MLQPIINAIAAAIGRPAKRHPRNATAAVVNAGGALRRLSLEEPSLDAIYNGYFQNQQMQGATHVHHAA